MIIRKNDIDSHPMWEMILFQKVKLGQSDLVSFIMVLAIPGDGKLDQAD